MPPELPTHDRRRFLEAAGATALALALAPDALAARPLGVAIAPAAGTAGAKGVPGPPSTFSSYQSQIYLAGMGEGRRPRLTTDLIELEARAVRRLSRRARETFLASAGGAAAVRAHARAFSAWRIVPRMFIDRAERNLNVNVLGTHSPAPVMLGPVAQQGLANPEGETASARAAAALGIPFIRSARASRSAKEVAAASGAGPRWYEVDLRRDSAVTAAALRRVRELGYTHLVVASPAPGQSWARIRGVAGRWDGPIVASGIRTAQGARTAARNGVSGIIVSPGEARPRRGSFGTVNALPAIARAVGRRLAVVFGGDIRSAPDVYKAVALGADAVLLGRPYVYGLALDGEVGVTHVLRTLLAELDLTIANAGYANLRDLGRDDLARARPVRRG
jgi:lactate 2-monooxygenase